MWYNITIIIILFSILFYKIHIFFVNSKSRIREFSCKFTEDKKFNDTRFIVLCNELDDIESFFSYFKIDNKLREFYYKNKTKTQIMEIGYGYDHINCNVSKLYLGCKNEYIYGIEKIYNTYNFRYYKPIEVFYKTQLDSLIGLHKSNIFYSIFNIDKNYSLCKSTCYSKHDYKYGFNVNSYHIYVGNYNLIIGENKHKIKSLLQLFKLNLNDIDIWFNKYRTYRLYWISFTKKNNKIEFSLYYRQHKQILTNKYLQPNI